MRLQAIGLGFGYPGKPVGRNVDLSVGPGEVVCLLGPNGSGKTTLFRTLLGLIPAQAGTILLDGVPLGILGRTRIARTIAYVPQAQSSQFSYSVLDIALMGRAAHLGPCSAPGSNDMDVARGYSRRSASPLLLMQTTYK